MAITFEDLTALNQGSVVLFTATIEEVDVPFFRVAYIEQDAWVSPNGVVFLDEDFSDVLDDLELLHAAEVPEEAKR